MTWVVPVWAKIGFAFFGVLILTGFTRYLFRDKLVVAFRNLPVGKREKLVAAYRRLVRTYTFALWFIPINGGLSITLAHAWGDPDMFFLGVLVLLSFIVLVEDYLFRRAVLRKIARGPETA